MILKEEELKCIEGGAGITATLITAVFKCYSFVHDLGLKVGSAVRYIQTKRSC